MNPTKLVLHFSDFSTIFYTIYKNQGNGNTIEVVVLHRGPYIFFKVHKYALGLPKSPWKELNPRN
jgi:hypothetical protein